MFETVCIRRLSTDRISIDIGALAEALLFYGTVWLACESGTFARLLEVCGYEPLLDLCQMGVLRLQFLENLTGVLTANSPTTGGLGHDFALFSSANSAWEMASRDLLRRATGKSGKGRRIAAKFDKFVTRELHPDGISERIREDIRDTNFLTEAIQQIVRELAPGYPVDRIQFSLTYDGSLFQPSTNIDFQLFNVLAPRDPAVHPNPIGLADLLVWIYSSRASVELAAAHNADLGVHPLEFRLATLKLRQLLERTVSSGREIGSFQQFVMPEGASLREIINSGNRTFAEVVALVDKAKKFRTWVRGRPADSQLLREYITEVTKIDWLETLPTKVLRWLLFTGIGLAVDGATGALGGIAVSAADAFLLDRLLHGWRPNEFIEGPLSEFVKTVSSAKEGSGP